MGRSVSVRAESILIANQSCFNNSFSKSSGGSLYISKSVLRSFNIVIRKSRSDLGSGIVVTDSSEIIMKKFQLEINKAEKSGGAFYCKQSEITFEEGNVELIMPIQLEVLCSQNTVK